jgi:hypothetical protein
LVGFSDKIRKALQTMNAAQRGSSSGANLEMETAPKLMSDGEI